MSKYLAYALLFVLAGCATRNDSLPAEELKIPATMPDVDINQEYCNGMISNASMAYGGLVPAAHYLDQMGKQSVFITRVQQECIGRANAAAHQTEKAYNWFRRSADNGSIPALVRAAAESTQLKKRPEDFRELLLRAAQTGHPESLSNYGASFLLGSPSFNDKKKALPILEEAYRRGYLHAGMITSYIYYGEPEFENFQEKGKNWLLKVANAGSKKAMISIAEHTYNGTHGFAQSTDDAFSWTRRASQDSPFYANQLLASWYVNGKHTEHNFQKAYELLTEASKNGHGNAIKSLKSLTCNTVEGTSNRTEVCAYFPLFQQHYYQLIVEKKPWFTLDADAVEAIDLPSPEGKLSGGCKAILKDYDGSSDFPSKIETARECQFYIDGEAYGENLYWEW